MLAPVASGHQSDATDVSKAGAAVHSNVPGDWPYRSFRASVETLECVVFHGDALGGAGGSRGVDDVGEVVCCGLGEVLGWGAVDVDGVAVKVDVRHARRLQVGVVGHPSGLR